ncbi:hypothetical protein [Laribacter hongkongensis]|uniref:hypothetical protein n=1 Tax=Laribacter hongkongensis TaxID=168471 RepID=UPI001E2D84FC|nr:hypothetical protein [Laribacter hongkongensis]
MNKTETIKQLPSTAPAAGAQMQRLETTIARLDETLAIAINRIETQQDAMAADLLPVVELRDQMMHVLTEAFKTLKTTTTAAKDAKIALTDTLSVLQERAQLLATVSQNSKPVIWKSSLAAGLVSAVLVAALLTWWQPGQPLQMPTVTVDAQALSDQIILKWSQRQQHNRTHE